MFEISLEAKQKYLVRRKDDLVKCKEAFSNQDTTHIERVGHQIKGNASTFGFEDLATIGTELEVAAKSKNWQKIESLIHQFESWINKT